VALLIAPASAQAVERPSRPELRSAVAAGVHDFKSFFDQSARIKTRIRQCRLQDGALTCRVRLWGSDERCRFRAHSEHYGDDFLYWQSRRQQGPRR
jgi:hypothetical protein